MVKKRDQKKPATNSAALKPAVDSRGTDRARYFGRNHVPASPAKLKGDPNSWGRRVDAWRVKHKLSFARLEQIVDPILRHAALYDLCTGEYVPRLSAALKVALAGNIRAWMRERGFTEIEIEKEVAEIVKDPKDISREIEEMITNRTSLTIEAQKYFNLRKDPFAGDVDKAVDIFTTPYFDKLVAQLEDAINFQKFVVVIGDIGSGKRNLLTLLNNACSESNGEMFVIYPDFANMEVVSAGAICSVILEEFGQTVPRDRVTRYRRVKNVLESKSNQGIRVALGFDSCERLDRKRLLPALKNFYEMGSGGFQRYLGLILFGQPKFRDTLNESEFREIAERIDVLQLGYEGKKVSNLGRHSWDYVDHRLKKVGGAADRLFDRDVVTQLARISNTPQGLGNLCNAALNQAFEIKDRKVHKGVLKSHDQIARALQTTEGVKVRAARNL